MSHIHIPDGVLPVWLWGPGWLLAFAAVLSAAWFARRSEARRKVPLLGVVSALMLVAMSSELVPIAYHINLTVIGGALLGPALSIVAAFIVELVLAMLGHGGVTVLGLNTLVIGAEMVLGWALFRGLLRLLGRPRVRPAAFVATVMTLFVSTSLFVAIVALSGVSGATQRETGALDASSLTFADPFSGGVFSVGLLSGDEHADDGSGEGEHADPHGDEDAGEHAEDPHAGSLNLSVRRFAAVVYTLGPIGWVIEALITAGVLGHIARVRPELAFSTAIRAPATETPPQDPHAGRSP